MVIIDCDTHLMPRDAFDGIDGELAKRKPKLQFDDQELYVNVDFPGYPAEVQGTSPLLAPGSGAMFKSLWDPESRMADYDNRLGIEQHVVLPQFSGWWSYLIEPELACRMARSHNEALLRLMKEYPGRILGVALVPLQDVPAGIREMEWAMDNGFCAVVLDKVYPVKEHALQRAVGQPSRALAVLQARSRIVGADLSAQRAARPPHEQPFAVSTRRALHLRAAGRADELGVADHQRSAR